MLTDRWFARVAEGVGEEGASKDVRLSESLESSFGEISITEYAFNSFGELAGDFRIDNFEELSADFGLPAFKTQAELILYAFEAHGERFINAIEGVFSFVIWNSKKKSCL